VSDIFDTSALDTSFLHRFGQLVPGMNAIAGRMFSATNRTLTFINTRILPLISSTKQLNELAFTWLVNRVHAIVEQRQKTPISRADLLNLMLESVTKKAINVSRTF
jgi:hypothetical protein